MFSRLLIGFGLVAVVIVAVVLGALRFAAGEAEAQTGNPCWDQCLLIVDFNGDTVFNVDDVLLFVEGYENQAPAFDKDADGDVDVFDVLAYAKEVRDCIRQCPLPTPPSGP